MTVSLKETKEDVFHASSDHVDESSQKEGNAVVGQDNLGMTPEEYDAAEKSLVRKLDLTLVPMVWLLYLFNYLDRNNIASVPNLHFD